MRSEPAPYLSVIIPTYNRAALLSMTLESFIDQDYPRDRYEIIVSDNNSTDNTSAVVAEYLGRAPVAVRYCFEPRQGVHFARNSAAKLAAGEILYFTDDDMVADPRLLSELVRVFELFPDVGCATGLILPQFQTEPPAWVKRHLWNAYLSLTARDKAEELIVSRDDMVYSCHQGIRRAAFFAAGGFNPENTAGTWVGDGETGLNLKVKALGYKFAYTGRSVIRHLIPPQRMTAKYLLKRVGNQGFCDSYTAYRSHRRKGRILPEMFKRSTVGAVKLVVMTMAKILLGLESWHFLPARILYLYNRYVYDKKLYFDDNFRKIVEVDDWLNSDTDELEIKM
ncbi:glycosyltransferase [Citrifermentans bremense]|uniref:glycosyltransferase n=1 Tax=Citrifermentans bremense TaxID=60035 RepID=UPI0004799556|nr:glycosyltransferase family 2 protein [Citrifermentans bremense]